MSEQGLIVRDVSVVYRNGNLGLDKASFEVPSSTIAAVVGANGSGKSTLFKSIMGFIPLHSGEVRVFGDTVAAAVAKQNVAYVPQAEDVDWDFPVLVEDVVMMGRYGYMGWLRRASKADHEAVDEALERMQVSDLRKRQIGELSGGQKKRVFLARALAQQSQLILLDEPFTGVDVAAEERIVELLLALKASGKLILISTHNLGSVPQFCDYSVLVNKKIIASGPTNVVFSEANLQKVFGGALRHHVLSADDLHHDSEDTRQVTVLTDDERPFVIYGEKDQSQ